MLMTQFINKSSQTIPIHRAGAGKNDLLLWEFFFIIFIVIKRQVSGSVLILEYGQNRRLTIYQFARAKRIQIV